MNEIPNSNEQFIPQKENNKFRGILKNMKLYTLIAITSIIGKDALSQGPNINPDFPQDSIIFNTVQAVGTDSLENNTTEQQRNERFDAENKFAQKANQTDFRLQNIMQTTVYRSSDLVETSATDSNLFILKNFVLANPADFPLEDVVNFMAFDNPQLGLATTASGYGIIVTHGNLALYTDTKLYNKYHEVAPHKILIHGDGLNGIEESVYNNNNGASLTTFTGATIMTYTAGSAPNGRHYFSLNPLYNTGMVANGGTGEFTRQDGNLTITTPATALNKTPISSTDKLADYNVAHPETLHKEAVAPPVAPILHLDIPTGRIWIVNQADFANFYTGVFHRDTNGIITPATKPNGEHYGTDEMYKWYLKDASNLANLVGNIGFLPSDTIYMDSLNVANADSLTAHIRSFYSNGKSPDGNNIQTDIEAPSIPTLSANNETPTTIDLNWLASTDLGSGLAGYRVFQDGTEIAGILAGLTNYTVSGLNELTTYNFQIIATDSVGNESPSAIVSATTTDGTAPNVTITVADTLVKELDENGEATIDFADFGTATDASGYTTSVSEDFANCDNVGETLTINWSVTDNSPASNDTSGTQFVKIEENLAPTISPKNFVLNLNTSPGGKIYPEDLANFDDNCNVATTLIDGQNFISITEPGTYTKTVTASDESNNLEERDITFEVSNTVGVENIENFAGFQAYPTVDGQNLIIESGENNIKEFFILNALGQVVLSSNTKLEKNEMATYPIGHLANGLYFLKAKNEKGEISLTQKISKN